MFDTLSYAKKLEGVGVSREQAETHVQLIAEIVEDSLATKQDLKDLRDEMNHQFKDVRDDMQKLEYRLVIKLGVMVSAVFTVAISVLVAILKTHS
ncbi:MAG: DUF1640 domain-containing protein [Bdellovibrionota bacterium]